MELYFGVSGMGAVLHTINPRLTPDTIAWIVNHASDKILCFDLTFLPIIEAIAAKCPSLRAIVAMTDRAHLPASAKCELACYEDLVNAHSDRFEWPELDENTASSLCYTSGTTGHPKGVLYSHRSTVLHTYGLSLPDSLGLAAADTVLPVVPMFHVNAWGIPYAAPMVGAKIVFPGPHLDGKSLHDLLEAEHVTVSAGVPTVWQNLLAHTESQSLKFSSMRRTVIGGSACPPAMIRTFQEKYGVRVLHAWGMTETSPVGTVNVPTNRQAGLDDDARFQLQCKQGRPLFGVDVKIVGDDGGELPWDGKAFGDLLIRGPWVIREFFNAGGDSPLVDGWYPTGDVATIDPDGFVQLTDRSKDVIKSGGEWISSIELENIAMSHPGVAMAACIAAKHAKWDERPLLVVVRKQGAEVTREQLLDLYPGKVAKWQVPDDVVFVESIPLGATGKMLKTKLREQLADYLMRA
jgi:fatty-acyl-CoA synthase